MIARYRAWRRRRLIAQLQEWVGLFELTHHELVRVGIMRKNGKTPRFVADRIQARRARLRLSATPGGFAVEAVHGRAGHR